MKLIRTGAISFLASLALLLPTLAAPPVASGHAAVVSSQPEPGQRLPAAPGVVSLHFTEPLNQKLSRATVTDPTGRPFEDIVARDQEIQVRLASGDAPGIYLVAWTTVSTLDGHTLRGTFRFGVRADPGSGEAEIALAPQPADLWMAGARALEYAALLMAIGMLLVGYLARRSPPLGWVRARIGPPLAVAFAGGLVVVLGEALSAAPTATPAAVRDYLIGGLPGAARLLRVNEELAALALAYSAPRLAPIPLALAVGSLAAAGHAAAIRPPWLGIGVDSVHLIAAGLWAGGILALATLRPPDGWRGPAARALLTRFSTVAIPAFVVTVASGALRGVQEIGQWSELVTSAYGQVLSVKVLVVLAMVPLSILAWRARRPSPRIEASLGAAAIVAAALLAAFPLPPARVTEAEEVREATGAASALPEEGDLTLGGDAGDVLVGLTLRPGTPGPNNVLVYLLPLDGERAADGIGAELVVGDRAIKMEGCAATCRRGRIDVVGGERVEVRLGGGALGSAAFDLPGLPAPDGADLLARMRARMRQLRSLRYEETLGPSQPPTSTRYALQSPDRLRYDIDGGTSLVWIGPTRYLRDRPDGPWREEQTGFSLEVMQFVWGGPGITQLISPRLLGSRIVDGVQTQVLTFLAHSRSTPIWFEVAVDGEGLVRQAEMRAQGHFMKHHYFDFDAPLTIEPPT